MCRAQRRNRQPRLCPGGRVRGVSMHHTAKRRITPIQRQMGRRVRRRTPFTVNDVSFKIDHHHIVSLHGVIRHTARLNHDQPLLAIDSADVTPGEGDQAIAGQIHVGFKDLLFKLKHVQPPVIPRAPYARAPSPAPLLLPQQGCPTFRSTSQSGKARNSLSA